MANQSFSSETLNRGRILSVINALVQAEAFDENSFIPPELDMLALEVIKAVGLTMAEFTAMEERPEEFGGQENRGWHIIIRNVLGRYWSEVTQAMVPPFTMQGDIITVFRLSTDYQLMLSSHMSNARATGLTTADATREQMDAALWMWLERAIHRIMGDPLWYTGEPSSNFHYLFEECERDVRRAFEEEKKRADTTNNGTN
jgi:hypothetical protein